MQTRRFLAVKRAVYSQVQDQPQLLERLFLRRGVGIIVASWTVVFCMLVSSYAVVSRHLTGHAVVEENWRSPHISPWSRARAIPAFGTLSPDVGSFVGVLPADKKAHFHASRAAFLLGDTVRTKYGTAQVGVYQTLAVGVLKEMIADSGIIGSEALSAPVLSEQQRRAITVGLGIRQKWGHYQESDIMNRLIDLVRLARERDALAARETILGQACLFADAARLADGVVADMLAGRGPLMGGPLSLLCRFNREQIGTIEKALRFRGLDESQFQANPLYANLVETDEHLRRLQGFVVEAGLDAGDIRANLAGILSAVSGHYEREMRFAAEREAFPLSPCQVRDAVSRLFLGDPALRDYFAGPFRESLQNNRLHGYYARWREDQFRYEFNPFAIIDEQIVFDQKQNPGLYADPEKLALWTDRSSDMVAAFASLLPPPEEAQF